MKILITGGAGMVGSHAAEFYAKKGCDVVVLDNLMRSFLFNRHHESVEYNWEYLSNYKNITRIKGDVRNDEDVTKAVGDGVDAVIHTAGQPGVGLSVRLPKEDFSINAYGTVNVLEHIRQICPKATFVYCSTNKVYGENVDKYDIVEKETRYSFKDIVGVNELCSIDHHGHTPYGASKYTGDIYVQEYAKSYGIKTAVFRMSCIYGTRQFGFEDQGWVAWFIIAALTNQKITLFGNGKQVRDVLFVEDLIEAYDKFITSNIQHCVWNIGGGPKTTSSLLEFLKIIEEELNVTISYDLTDWRPSDQKVYISDITKIKNDLGWEPKISFKEGIHKLIRWAQKNKNLFKK